MKFIYTIAALIILFNTGIKCDQRNFVWTYEYMVMDTGSAEIEQYTTFASPDASNLEGNTNVELNYEIEVGMNKHYDFAVYQNFKQDTAGKLKYSGFKLRSRFLIGEKNQFFMDPLIYLEYIGKPDFSVHEFEAKLILEKDFGRFRLSLNPYFELEFTNDETEFKPKYALGIGYKVSNLFHIGIESKGDEHANYIGPTIAHGGHRFWMALGALKSIGTVDLGSAEFQVRLILGLHI